MEPHYVVINPGFEGDDAQPLRWLGRIVARMETPSEKYAPFKFDMVPILSDYMLQPMHDLNAVIFAEGIRDKRCQLAVMKWIQAAAETTDEKIIKIKSPKIATFSLQQHDKVLKSLKAKHQVLNEMLEILRQSGRKAYMIVGVKVLYKAVVCLGTSESWKREIEITAPVVEAAMCATGAPLGSVLDSNPRGAVSWSSENSKDVLYTLERPRIFALEYREVVYKKSLFKRKSDPVIISMDAPEYKKEHYVFGDDDDAPDSAESSTDEDELFLVDSTVSSGDINDGDGWGECDVDLPGNKSASCVLIHEVDNEEGW